MSSPETTFAKLVIALSKHRDVTPPEPGRRKFGSSALRVDAKIFAFLKADALVVKLPARRVAALIAAGDGAPFDAGKGTPMKQWLAVRGRHAAWPKLAREALAFVRG
jgi:hypothetical protein